VSIYAKSSALLVVLLAVAYAALRQLRAEERPTDDSFSAKGVRIHYSVKSARIVGYSLGGMIAIRFVGDHPDRTLSDTLAA
jgi:pimeloyl-ACP methyl ester carboxylesterase